MVTETGLVPYCASAGWYRTYVRCRLSGLGEAEAVAEASRDVRGRDMARCVVGLDCGQVLSVPVSGGSSALKNRDFIGVVGLSEHGRWRAVHCGTLSAIYGRTPFFTYFSPCLFHILDDNSVQSLRILNEKVHTAICRFLDIERIVGSTDMADRISGDYVGEIKRKVNYNISILDAIFRLGRDTVFALIR